MLQQVVHAVTTVLSAISKNQVATPIMLLMFHPALIKWLICHAASTHAMPWQKSHSCSNIIFCGTSSLLSLLMKRIFLARCHILMATDLEPDFREDIRPAPCSDASNLSGQIRHRCTNYGQRTVGPFVQHYVNSIGQNESHTIHYNGKVQVQGYPAHCNTVSANQELTHSFLDLLISSLTHDCLVD